MGDFESILDNYSTVIKDKLSGLRGAFEAGSIIAEDVFNVGNFLVQEIGNLSKMPGEILESIRDGHYENKYRALVAELTVQEMLELQASSIEQMKEANSQRLQQLAMIRTIIDLPSKIRTVLQIIV